MAAILVFKMNALVDERIMEPLVRASQAGVRSTSSCAASAPPPRRAGRHRERPRHEHRRTVPRAQPDLLVPQRRREEVYLGSADLMPRNLERRVEVIFPVTDAALVHHREEELEGQPRDHPWGRGEGLEGN